jgi:hypothetical protein
VDKSVAVRRYSLKHRGDQVCVGRQRDVFLRTGADRANGGSSVGCNPTSDNRHVEPFGLECLDQYRDVEPDIDHDETLTGPERHEAALDIINLGHFRAARDRDLAGCADIAGEGSDNEDTHVDEAPVKFSRTGSGGRRAAGSR